MVGGFSPSEKYEFVSWDYSQYMKSHKIHVPNHQSDEVFLKLGYPARHHWGTPLSNMTRKNWSLGPPYNWLISWDYYSQYMKSHKIPWFQTTNQIRYHLYQIPSTYHGFLDGLFWKTLHLWYIGYQSLVASSLDNSVLPTLAKAASSAIMLGASMRAPASNIAKRSRGSSATA